MRIPNKHTVTRTAFELGLRAGKRNADDQYLWGGRVTRRCEAEATARAYLRASEDGEQLNFIDDQPFPYADQFDTLQAVRIKLGETSVINWMTDEELTESEAAEITAQEWMMGYTDGILDALEESARSFLAND